MVSGFFAKSLIVIDAQVDDYQSLIKGISVGYEVIVLNRAENGVRQITLALRDRPHLQTLHIISHGAPGTLFLGNSELSLHSLDRHASDLQSWSVSAILLYGCNAAAGDVGAEFIEKLHQITNAEIAASTTPIGSAILGGNWDLDVQTGSMNTELAIAPAAQRSYASILSVTINPTGGSATNGSDGLRIVLTLDGSFQIFYRGGNQVFGANASATALGIGNATVGSAYMNPNRVWDTLSQSAVTGNGSQASPFTVVTSLFDDRDNDNVFDAGVETRLDYTVSYVLGNPYFSQTFQITPTTNNTQTIKLFQGMDTFLAGGDAGPAYGLNSQGTPISSTSDNPVLIGTVKNLGQSNESFLAYVQSGRAWDSWYSGGYWPQFTQVNNGGNLVKTFDPRTSTDNGIGVQYNLGAITAVTTIRNKLTFSANTAVDLATNTTPTVTGTAQTLNYTPNGSAVDFGAMTVSDPDSADVITASFTLSNPGAGSLSSSAGGNYNFSTGVWSISGTIAQVNAALDVLQFTPANGFSQNTSIAVRISDGTDIVDSSISLQASAPVQTAAPTGLALPADAANDTGVSQSDRITRNLRPQITGSAEPGSTIKLYANGTEIAGSVTISGSGSWTFTPTVDLPIGTVSITATATNASGIESSASSSLSVTIDNSIATPSIPDLTTDSGLPTDNITNVVRPTLQGTAEPNSTIRLYGNGILLPVAITANDSGNWSYTPNADLPAGNYVFKAVAVDTAGNVSGDSPELTVTIDNTPPSIDPASKPDLLAIDDTGVSDTDDKTNLTNLTFTGQLTPAEAGLLVRIYDGNTVVGTGAVTPSGAWSVNTTNLGTGNRSIAYTLTDLAGNESQRSGALSVEVSTAAPTLPGNSTPDLTAASDTGTSSTDDRTGDNTPEFVGQLTPAAAGFTVTIYSDSMPVGTGVVNPDGSWSVVTAPLDNGSTGIRYTLTDLFGNESQPSDALTVEIDAVIPPAPTIAPDLTGSSDTGMSQTDDITADNTPTFSGTGTAGQIVRLYNGNTQVGEAVVAPDGNWTITASTLEAGDRVMTTTFVDPLTGNESLKSPTLVVKIDPAAIVTPRVNPGNRGAGTGDSSNPNDGLTNNSKPPLGGVTDPSSTIEVLANGQPLQGTATVNPDGTWSFTPAAPLPDGTYQVVVRSTSPSGGAVLSPESTLIVDTKPATVKIIDTLSDLRDTSTSSLTLQFSEAIKNLDLSDLTLTLNGRTVNLQGATLTARDAQTWVLGNLPSSTAPSGEYRISINPGRITDLAGNSLTVGATDSWLTGYTANALPLARSGGRLGMRISGSSANNWTLGTQRRDILRGGSGNDFLLGSGGNDRLLGGRGRDRLAGGRGNDRAIGGSGNDRLQGFRGQDILTGGSGNDFLAGGAGDDLLQGGRGNDRLRGGVGRDTFAVNSFNERVDRVLDFNASEDLIDLRGIMGASQYRADNRFAQYHQYVKLVQAGSNTEVQVDTDGRGSGTAMTTVMILQGVNGSSVQSTNFVIG